MIKVKSYFDLTAPEIAIRSLFDKYDNDNSGILEESELRTLFQDDFGLSSNEAEAYCLLIDKDASGGVAFDEFNSWLKSGERFNSLQNKSRFSIMQHAVELFKSYDRDHSGALDRSEFSRLHADVGGKPEGLVLALNQLDKDGNGQIYFYEFMKWLNWNDMGSL